MTKHTVLLKDYFRYRFFFLPFLRKFFCSIHNNLATNCWKKINLHRVSGWKVEQETSWVRLMFTTAGL